MAKICFLLGIMPRCGTNFLENQLRLHPKCKAPGPIWEDFLVSGLPQLSSFTGQFDRRWDKYWFRNTEKNYYQALRKNIGKGLETFLYDQLEESEGGVLISKTPTVKGLENFDAYFSDCKLILIVRDGRSVVESGQKSFNWNFEKAAYDWRINARKILKFRTFSKQQSQLVKFEDLCQNASKTIQELVEYLELEYSEYPQDELTALPVSGSSQLKDKSGELHWKGVKKDANFNPVERHANWSKWKKKVFSFIAHKEMKQLGYTITTKLNFFDKCLISLYLLTWPLRVAFSTPYYLLKEKSFNLKTN